MDYIQVGKNQFHVKQSLAMGKDTFIEKHKGQVRDVRKVWEAIEAENTKVEKPSKNKAEQAPETK